MKTTTKTFWKREVFFIVSLYATQVSMHLTLGAWFLKSLGSVKSITDPYPASPLWLMLWQHCFFHVSHLANSTGVLAVEDGQ